MPGVLNKIGECLLYLMFTHFFNGIYTHTEMQKDVVPSCTQADALIHQASVFD